MKRHARVLRRALNEPVQRVPLLNLELHITHNTTALSAAGSAAFQANRAQMGRARGWAGPAARRADTALAPVWKA